MIVTLSEQLLDLKTSSSYRSAVVAVTKAQAARAHAETELAEIIQHFQSFQDDFKAVLTHIPACDRTYQRSALEQAVITVAVDMSPPGAPYPYHGKLDAAKCDFTALLAAQHVKATAPAKPLPKSPPAALPYHDPYGYNNSYGSRG